MPLLEGQTPNIVDLRIDSYKTVVVDADTSTSQDLSQLVSSIQCDYDLDQPAEHYTLTFVHTEDIAHKIKPGDRVKLYGYAVRPVGSSLEMYWELLKRIYIAATSISSDQGGTLKATGYNVMWYIMRNKDTVMLENETASQFITRTAAYYGIPLGTIADTGVQLEREPFMNRTVWDMWVSALSYTRDINTNAKFLLQEKEGKIELVNRVDASGVWNFHRGQFIPGPESWENNPGNIFSSQNNFSMENYSNVVRVYKGGNNGDGGTDFFGGGDATGSAPTLQFQYPAQELIESGNVLEINKYGMFVESINLQAPGEVALDLGNDKANAEQQGMKLYKKVSKFENTGTITTFNINTIRPGDAVHIKDEITGLVGKYYVKSGSHVVSDEEASMSLTVNIEDALPEVYAARAQPKASGTDFFGGGGASAPSGRNWTKMSGSVSIPDRYALAVGSGFAAGDDAIKMTTISLFECGNCDMSVPNATNDVGLWQINAVHWPTYGGPEVLQNPPANARAAFGVWKGAGGGEAGFRQWHVYPNWDGAGGGISKTVFDAKMAEVRAIVSSAGTKSETGWIPVDMRGKLPTNHEGNYEARELAGIVGVTLHYTAGSPSDTVYAVAQYQTSEAARGQPGPPIPFPGLAYTLFVEADGKTSAAWDLGIACWHSNGPGRNQHYIGICYAGNVAPNDAQMTAMGQAIGWCQKQLGKKLTIEGHMDTNASVPVPTECPGPQWPSWKQTVINRIPLTI